MKKDLPKYQDKNWLEEQYLILERKVVDIARECNVNIITIGRWRKKFGFPSRKFSQEALLKMSEYKRGKFAEEENHNWKGDNVGYHCLHKWIQKNKPKPEACQKCGKKQKYLELANLSGEYKRDIEDYIYLCVRCHKEMDGTLKSFIKGGKETRFKKGNIPWNTELPPELQPNFRRTYSEQSKLKVSKAKKKYWAEKKQQKNKNLLDINQSKIEVYSN